MSVSKKVAWNFGPKSFQDAYSFQDAFFLIDFWIGNCMFFGRMGVLSACMKDLYEIPVLELVPLRIHINNPPTFTPLYHGWS